MKALLPCPEFPNTLWSFKHALKFIRKKAALPPLGLLTVAAMPPQDWAKRLVDVNVRKLRAKELAWAEVGFISEMIAQQDSADVPGAGVVTMSWHLGRTPHSEGRSDGVALP